MSAPDQGEVLLVVDPFTNQFYARARTPNTDFWYQTNSHYNSDGALREAAARIGRPLHVRVEVPPC